MKVHLVEVFVGGFCELLFPVRCCGSAWGCCRHANQNDNKERTFFHRCRLESLPEYSFAPTGLDNFPDRFPRAALRLPWAIFSRSLRELGELRIRHSRLIMRLPARARGSRAILEFRATLRRGAWLARGT